jgi:hypothetical protein
LAEAIEQVEQNIAPHRKAVLASTFGPALRRHIKELQQARQTYGPVRLSKAWAKAAGQVTNSVLTLLVLGGLPWSRR